MEPRHPLEAGTEASYLLPKPARRAFEPADAFSNVRALFIAIPIVFFCIVIGCMAFACWRRYQLQNQAQNVQDAGQVAAAPPGTYAYNPNGVQMVTVGPNAGMVSGGRVQQAYPPAPYYGAQPQQFPQPGVYGYHAQNVMSAPPPPPTQQYNAVNGTPIMRL